MIRRTALILVCVAVALSGVLFGQSAADRDRAKSGVVMLRSEFPGETPQQTTRNFGAGVITAVKDDEVYVVTAEHVVRKSGEFSKAITVQFDGRRGEWFEARRLDFRDSGLDLSVLRVPLPPKVNAATLMAVGAAPSAGLTRGADVYPLGFKAEGPWGTPVAADKIDQVSIVRLTFASQYVAPGNSGGALLDACGRVVGMVTEIDNPSEARAIPIEVILDALKRWAVPTGLAPNGSACGAAVATPTPTPTPAPAPDPPRAGRASAPAQTPEYPSRARGRGGPFRPRWRVHEFPPPNGGLLAFTIMADGSPACASYDGGRCLWGVAYDQIDWSKIQPLVCGEDHRAKWGSTGYENPQHWCNLAKAVP